MPTSIPLRLEFVGELRSFLRPTLRGRLRAFFLRFRWAPAPRPRFDVGDVVDVGGREARVVKVVDARTFQLNDGSLLTISAS